MSFKESCESVGGELEEAEDSGKNICILEGKGMAITEDGETLPYGKPKG